MHIKTDEALFVVHGGRCRAVRNAQGQVLAAIQSDLQGAQLDGLIPRDFVDHPLYEPITVAALMERSGSEEDPSTSPAIVAVYTWREGGEEWIVQFTTVTSRRRIFGSIREILAPPQTVRTTFSDTPVARRLTPASGVEAVVPSVSDDDAEEADAS